MTDEQQKAWERLGYILRERCNWKHGAEISEELYLAADAEIKRLREAVEWACAHEQIPSWPYFIAELRRRAKEGICECGADAKQCAENREHHKIHLNRMGGE